MTDTTPVPAIDGFQLQDRDGAVATTLPVPAELARMIREHVERDVARLRDGIEERGGVLAVQDVFRPLRHLQQADELVADYVRVLGNVRKGIKLLIEEVAADGVGADGDGKPVHTITVPDQDGDISIRPQFKNTYTIQMEQVLPAFASMFADQHADAVIDQVIESANPIDGDDLPGVRAKVGALIAEAIADALASVGQLGKFEPQVTKVRAYADHLARESHDNAAAIVSSAIIKSRDYDSIKVERKK